MKGDSETLKAGQSDDEFSSPIQPPLVPPGHQSTEKVEETDILKQTAEQNLAKAEQAIETHKAADEMIKAHMEEMQKQVEGLAQAEALNDLNAEMKDESS